MHMGCGKDAVPDDALPQMDMVWISGGTFQMGSASEWAGTDDHPVHQVTVSSFSISRHEINQAQYEAVMDTNPSRFRGPDRPVEQIDWYDAAMFCNRLSEIEGLAKFYDDEDLRASERPVRMTWEANGYRLPTEAEWEYACRAGTTSDYYNGNETQEVCVPLDPRLDIIGWYCGNAGDETHEVGEKAPNGFGLYDMSGNVFEWCNDWWGEYSADAQTDPTGPPDGTRPVRRGGSWGAAARFCQSAARGAGSPDGGHDYLGFRPVRR
jgi:formylglycine-generating enzyme required for sulfatase activity